MAQAMAVSIPAGVNPNAAIPAHAGVTQHSGDATPPNPIPPVVPSTQQTEGWVPKPTVPSLTPAAATPAADPDYAAFLAWKATQSATPEAPKTEPVKPAAKPEAFDGIGATAAVQAVREASSSDPLLLATFSLFEMVAPSVDLARACGNAIDRGDPTLVDSAYLREAAGEHADRLIKSAQGLVQHVTETTTRIVSEIHTLAGGEAQFNAAVAAFNAKAPQYLQEFVKAGMDSNDPKRIRTATESLLNFVKESGALPRPPQGHVRAGGGTPDASFGLTKVEYQAERQKLDRNARDYAERCRELDARRQIGKRAGM